MNYNTFRLIIILFGTLFFSVGFIYLISNIGRSQKEFEYFFFLFASLFGMCAGPVGFYARLKDAKPYKDEYENNKKWLNSEFQIREPIENGIERILKRYDKKNCLPGVTFKHGNVTVHDFIAEFTEVRLIEKDGLLVAFRIKGHDKPNR